MTLDISSGFSCMFSSYTTVLLILLESSAKRPFTVPSNSFRRVLRGHPPERTDRFSVPSRPFFHSSFPVFSSEALPVPSTGMLRSSQLPRQCCGLRSICAEMLPGIRRIPGEDFFTQQFDKIDQIRFRLAAKCRVDQPDPLFSRNRRLR